MIEVCDSSGRPNDDDSIGRRVVGDERIREGRARAASINRGTSSPLVEPRFRFLWKKFTPHSNLLLVQFSDSLYGCLNHDGVLFFGQMSISSTFVDLHGMVIWESGVQAARQQPPQQFQFTSCTPH